MVIPLIAYFLGLFVVGFLHTLLSPVADAFFEVSTSNSATMTMLHSAWEYSIWLYAILAGLALILYAQKSGGGGPFG